ncbi:saccharopine dehydrogenase [Gammaproteobacteria bacterium 45_16_T64]|nr:saccharopine dehydrogenase [Gammaproteobacteria bacterium 45_16_T64]
MSDSQYDIIVFGATSFVGQILCKYLLDTLTDADSLNWAIAGRSQTKLDTLKTSLGSNASALQTIVADAASATDMAAMCKQANVIVSTVGPYALYGEPLVKACAESGTDYCDLTGEVQWIREMVQKYESAAKESGARIVHCCGFDSIPSDLGVYFLQQESNKQYGKPCERVKMRVKAMRGGASGGTVASMVNIAQEAASNPALRKELANPYSLCSSDYPTHIRQPNVTSATKDDEFSAWSAPFVMAAINTRIVQRSNDLSDQAYGSSFTYDEAMLTKPGIAGWLTAQSVTVGIGGFMVAAAIKPSRWLLEKYVLPAPGEGPSPSAQEKGFYDLRFAGKTTDGQTLTVKVTGDKDPGYGSTSKMLGQSAISLVQDFSKADKAGGFWTPATMFGDTLIQRLKKHSGLTFEVL